MDIIPSAINYSNTLNVPVLQFILGLVSYPWSEDPHQDHLYLYHVGHLIQERAARDAQRPPPGARHGAVLGPARCVCSERPSAAGRGTMAPSTVRAGGQCQPTALPAHGCDVKIQKMALINVLVLGHARSWEKKH